MLGADRRALHAVRDRDDLDVTVLYGPDQKDAGRAPSTGRGDAIFVEDTCDPATVLAGLSRAGRPLETFDGVYTKDERLVVTAALLTEVLHPGAGAARTAVLFRDKALQKRCVRAAGLPAADFRVVDDIRDLDAGRYASFLPAVAKPVAGSGTRATRWLGDVAELDAFAAEQRRTGSGWRTFVLEEPQHGQEWTYDGICFEGRVVFGVLGRYDHSCLSALSAGKPYRMFKYGRHLAAEQYAAAEPLAAAALDALGLRSGVFHMELFRDPDTGTFVFSECAARRGGALTYEQVLHQFGVDLAAAAVDCALGRKPDLTTRSERGGVSGMSFLPAPGGCLTTCPDAAEIAARPGVVYAQVEVPAGAVLPENATDLFGHKLGQVMAFGPDQDTVSATLDDVVTWFRGRTRALPAHGDLARLRAGAQADGFVFEYGPTAVRG